MRVAIIEKNRIKNIIVSDKVGKGQFDVTGILCNIGDPIINGIPVPRPSNYHTLKKDNSAWEITKENQDMLDYYNIQKSNAVAKTNLKNIDKHSIRSIREFLILKFGDDALMPKHLKDFETEAETERIKIINEGE